MKIDFNAPDFDFVKEFRKLYVESPCCGAYTRASENCPYGDVVVVSKDCYMCFNCGQSRDACYCENSRVMTDCNDCGYCEQCEICYECVDCDGCYNCNFCQDCSNCESVSYGFDLRRCKDCIGCVALRDKQYCIFNEQLSREEYEKRKSDFDSAEISVKVEELKLKTPRVYSHQHDTADCTGDYVYHSKNCNMCFDARHSEDSAFVVMANLDRGTKDSFDCGPMPTGMDLCYDISYAHYLFNCRHIYFCGNLKDSCYVHDCFESEHLFGCCYMHNKQKKFYILNQEVEEDFYNRKTVEIEADLRARGVWSFHDLVYKDLSAPFEPAGEELMRSCRICGDGFEIAEWEVAYYKKHGIPYPIYCPLCRMDQRIKLRNEWKLYKRICDHCKKNIISTYTADTKHIVYCFECFWSEMG